MALRLRQKEALRDKKMKIAIVTYNRIGDGQFDNGVMQTPNAKIYIAQNGHRTKWAADSDNSPSDRENIRRNTARYVSEMYNLGDMDTIYLYVGNDGGEEAIRETAIIPAEKITYVMCGCNYGKKKNMIQTIGNADAKIVDCECGGRDTLERILEGFL